MVVFCIIDPVMAYELFVLVLQALPEQFDAHILGAILDIVNQEDLQI